MQKNTTAQLHKGNEPRQHYYTGIGQNRKHCDYIVIRKAETNLTDI